MFLKPFKVKSKSAIKGSDRKKLRTDLTKQYPSLSAAEIIPNKDDLTVVKVNTHGGDLVTVYCLSKYPIFFEVEKIIYPTVYTLWQYPDLLPTFTTWPPVFQKLSAGADLMLPGFVLEGEYGPRSFGRLNKGDVCSINLANNKAPIAVGKTALSSEDMFLSGKRGKGVTMIHTYLDQLWELGDKSGPPSLPSPLQSLLASNDDSDNDKDNKDCSDVNSPNSDSETTGITSSTFITTTGANSSEPDTVCLNSLNADDVQDDDSSINEENSAATKTPVDTKTPAQIMDVLLLQCFLQAWKTSAKKIELPLLTSTFYKAHMLPCCPRDKMLDVKKSSYKKLSKFLQEMQDKKLVEVKELSKGVESIVSVNLLHPEIRSYVVPDSLLQQDEASASEQSAAESKYVPPQIVEMYTITAAVLPLFKDARLGKGEALTVTEIRRLVTEYVKRNELQNENNKSLVTMNDTLAAALLTQSEKGTKSSMKWDELINRCLDKMKPAFQLKYPGQNPILKKGQLEPISVTIAQRAANKKVTLLQNLETYGIDPQAFAHAVQIGVAASTSVHSAPNKKEGYEVMVQGNQIKFISGLLLDQYQVPKKYIRGLENAAKAGKKR